MTTKTLSFAELYGSKICAALDRQHPRDIFDIMLLLQNEGITNEVRKAFLVYLISHNRPISELLLPNFQDIKPIFEKEFTGMTSFEVKYEKLVRVRETLVKEINKRITDAERTFLMSFKEGSPKWELLGIDGVEKPFTMIRGRSPDRRTISRTPGAISPGVAAGTRNRVRRGEQTLE